MVSGGSVVSGESTGPADVLPTAACADAARKRTGLLKISCPCDSPGSGASSARIRDHPRRSLRPEDSGRLQIPPVGCVPSCGGRGLGTVNWRMGIPHHAMSPFHAGNTEVEVRVPHASARFLRHPVFRMGSPLADGLFRRPVGDGDPEASRRPGALHAEVARLLCRELEHPVGHLSVTLISLGPQGGEDDREVRWLRRPGDAVGHARDGTKPGRSAQLKPWRSGLTGGRWNHRLGGLEGGLEDQATWTSSPRSMRGAVSRRAPAFSGVSVAVRRGRIRVGRGPLRWRC